MRWTAVVAVLACVACGKMPSKDDPKCDMSTDDKALAIYNKLTNHTRIEKGVCFDHRAEFPQYLAIGTLVPGSGCMDEVFVWKCEKIDTPPVTEVLQAAGWKSAKPSKRHELIDAWVRPMKSAHPKFEEAGQKFDPPTYFDTADGGVEITYWIMSNGENDSGNIEFQRRKLSFNADATPKPYNVLENFRP